MKLTEKVKNILYLCCYTHVTKQKTENFLKKKNS